MAMAYDPRDYADHGPPAPAYAAYPYPPPPGAPMAPVMAMPHHAPPMPLRPPPVPAPYYHPGPAPLPPAPPGMRHSRSPVPAAPARPPSSSASHVTRLARQLVRANVDAWLQITSAIVAVGGEGAPKEALASVQHALRQDPQSPAAYRALGRVYLDLGQQPEDAITALETAVSLAPDQGETYQALGDAYMALNQLERAYEAYQQALKLLPDPNVPELWYPIGVLYERYGSLEYAQQALERVVVCATHSEDRDEDRIRHALTDPERYAKLSEVLYRLGMIYRQQALYPESARAFLLLVDTPPAPLGVGDIYLELGRVYALAEDYASARDAFERALASPVPTRVQAHQALASLYLSTYAGFLDPDRARTELEAAAHLVPDEEDELGARTAYLSGRLHALLNEVTEAFTAYQKAIRLSPQDARIWNAIGVLYYRTNQAEDCLFALAHAAQIGPSIPETWFNLACLYLHTPGRTEDAQVALDRAERTTDGPGPRMDTVHKRLAELGAAVRAAASGPGAGPDAAPEPAYEPLDIDTLVPPAPAPDDASMGLGRAEQEQEQEQEQGMGRPGPDRATAAPATPRTGTPNSTAAGRAAGAAAARAPPEGDQDGAAVDALLGLAGAARISPKDKKTKPRTAAISPVKARR